MSRNPFRRRKGKGKCQTIPRRILYCCEWEQFNRTAMLIGGLLLLGLAALCRLAIGPPVYARHLFSMGSAMPTTLTLYLFGGILYLAHGALIAAMLVAPTPAILRDRFRGTALLVPMALFRLLWYPLLFGALTPALALISLFLAAMSGVCAWGCLRHVSRLAPLVLIVELIWILRLCMATVIVLVAN